MKCPVCKSRKQIDLDLHAEGFAQDARECGFCGTIWTFSGETIKIIQERAKWQEKLGSDFVCPTCNGRSSKETDLNAFQFHEELHECMSCGTICSTAHNQVEVVMDSQRGSFLDSTGEMVEADDYNMM